ncbi:MAG TPA: hypothetical protein VGM32_24775 [Rhodopila sp.]|jgi:hypothetical protein
MPDRKRCLVELLTLAFGIALIIPGCSSLNSSLGNDFERADDLGLPLPGVPLAAEPTGGPATGAGVTLAGIALPAGVGDYQDNYRDAFVEQWMGRSDYLCRQYKDKIIRTSRNWKLGTDVLTTGLAGLATIFTPAATVRPLAGAATIVSGSGAALQADTFGQQAGDVVASAIQTARENQANQIEFNLRSPSKDYNIYRAQRDVIEYHNMCSLETALKTIRGSLQATSPDGGRTAPAAQGSQVPGGSVAPELQILKGPRQASDFSIKNASNTVPGPIGRPPPTLQPKGLNDYERRLSQVRVSQIQSALCLATDGILGGTTRDAVKAYLAGRDLAGSQDGSIDGTTMNLIQKAIDAVGSCSAQGFLNAYEVGRYGVSPDRVGAIRELQTKLNRAVPDAHVPEDGSFLPLGAANKTREAIRRVRALHNLPELGGQVDAEMFDKVPELAAE